MSFTETIRRKMGICRLCNEDKDLLKKSHIYPNFVYTDLFDEHNRLRKFTANEMLKKNPRISRPPSGVYEGGLLCNDCDNRKISQLESYVAKLINGGNKDINCKTSTLPDGLKVNEVDSLDYKKLRNFIFSLLFRADISSFDEFIDVSLGPYNEKIKNVILGNDDVNDSEIQINLFQLSEDSNFNTLIGQPVRSRINAHTIYSLLMKGYLIVVSLRQNQLSNTTKELRLKSDGTIGIPIIPKRVEEKFIMQYFGVI